MKRTMGGEGGGPQEGNVRGAFTRNETEGVTFGDEGKSIQLVRA